MRNLLCTWPSEVMSLFIRKIPPIPRKASCLVCKHMEGENFSSWCCKSWLLTSSPSMARVVLCRCITASAGTSSPLPWVKGSRHTADRRMWRTGHCGLQQGGVQQTLASQKSPAAALQLSQLPPEMFLPLLPRAAAISCKQVKPAPHT